MTARLTREPEGDMGKRLETVRLRAGLTLADFHRRLGGSEFCSYQTVQNYHFDRQPSVQYLVRVADVFEEDLTWLATGQRGAADVTGRIRELLRLPEFKAKTEAHVQFLDDETRFLGPLRATVPAGLMQIVFSAHARIASHLSPGDRLTEQDYHLEDFTRQFDSVLTNTWFQLSEVLDTQIRDRASPTIDQQLRYVEQMRDVLLSLLPDRGIPAVTISEQVS